MVTSIKYPPEDDAKNDFLLVGPLVPIRTNWLQTKFSVLNFSKQSLNISPLCKNCLSDRFISDQNLTLADTKTCCLSFTKRSSERIKSYWLPKFKSVCFGSTKSFFRYLLEMGESSPKKLFKIARCFRPHLVSLFESF